VCVSPPYASFEPGKLAKLPLDVKIVVAPPEQLMHAKFYWFSGKDGPAAVVGSANCSAAAWLAGNTEIVVPYDSPEETEFKSILSLFKGKAHEPAKVLKGKAIQSDTPSSGIPSFRLVSLRLRSADNVEAVIQPPLGDDAEVCLVFQDAGGGKPVALRRRSEGWAGRLPANFQVGPLTLFAHAEGISAGVAFVTDARWIDNDGLLDRASRPAAMDTGLSKLSRQQFSARDDQQIIETIQAIAAQLLDPAADITEIPQFASKRSINENKTQETFEPVDASALIRSLSDISFDRTTSVRGLGGAGGSTLAGVMALLFGQKDTEDVDLKREAWSEEDFQTPADGKPTARVQPPAGGDVGSKSSSVEASISFRRELKLFLTELAKPSFAATCGVSQMVQALAFPLLLCLRGAEANWIPRSFLTRVATQVVEIMYNKGYGPGNPRGLLAMVRDRYLKASQKEGFLHAVGDGTLWLSLLTSLAIDPSESWQSVLPQASAMSAVFNSRELLAHSNETYLSGLLRSLDSEIMEGVTLQKVEAIAQSISALTKLLVSSWDALSKEQKSIRSLQPANSILWNSNVGWCVTEDTPAETSCPGYINLETAAEDHPEIKVAIERVYEACRIPQMRTGDIEGRKPEVL
jgi:hypothetical protein